MENQSKEKTKTLEEMVNKLKGKESNKTEELTKEKMEKIEQQIKEKKRLPKNQSRKVFKLIIENLVFAIIMILYFVSIYIGITSIEETKEVIKAIQILNIGVIIIVIACFEFSYKKEDVKAMIVGIEFFVIATLGILVECLIPIEQDKLKYLIEIMSGSVIIYCAFKSWIMYVVEKKEYIKKQNDIKEIVKKEKR